jgi:multidrug efflux system membrane fusion protein
MKIDRIEKTFTTAPRVHPTTWRRQRWFVGIVIILAIAAGYIWFYAPRYLPGYVAQYRASEANGRGGGGLRHEAPVPVLVAVAKKADVPVYFDGVGSSRALNTVTVRAQVDGKLMSVNFKEGQDVDQDFVLAEIDATIFQAQYDQAVAKKAMDEAQLANARLDLDRYVRLVQTNSATRQQYDTQRALVAQLAAQVQADQGAIDNSKAILSYTKIVAPLAGRTGIRQVDAGNIVHAADTTGIVVITQVRPIAIIFTLPQQRLAEVNKAFVREPLSVVALGDDDRTVIDRGTLTVIDNQVDQTTGTVKLKAEFPNADLQIWPGQFVNVKLLVDTLRQVTVVPTAAVQRGPNGTFAYVAGDDDAVTVRPVTVAQQDEIQTVIASGIDHGERVITTGFSQLTDGAKITIGVAEGLGRPAGSERRRSPPRQTTPSARSEPRAKTVARSASPEPSRGAPQRRTPAGGASSATPRAYRRRSFSGRSRPSLLGMR